MVPATGWQPRTGASSASGSATYWGSLPGLKVHVSNIVGIAPTADGGGYWLVGSDGGVFALGDATYAGSLPGDKITVSDIVGIVPTADGGYYLVGKDGGVFAFGDAPSRARCPATGSPSPTSWASCRRRRRGLLPRRSDGGVFAFGDAVFEDSVPGDKIKCPTSWASPSTPPGGYWVVGRTEGSSPSAQPATWARSRDRTSTSRTSWASRRRDRGIESGRLGSGVSLLGRFALHRGGRRRDLSVVGLRTPTRYPAKRLHVRTFARRVSTHLVGAPVPRSVPGQSAIARTQIFDTTKYLVNGTFPGWITRGQARIDGWPVL